MVKIFRNEEKPYEEIVTTDFAKQDVSGKKSTDKEEQFFDDAPNIISPVPESTVSIPLKPLDTRVAAKRAPALVGDPSVVNLLGIDLNTITKTGAAEETVKDFIINGKLLTADNGALRLTLYAENSAGNVATFKVFYGDLASSMWGASLGGNNNGTLSMWLSNLDDDQSQQSHGYIADEDVSQPIDYGIHNDRSIDSTLDQTFRITVTTPVANNISIKGIYLELLKRA